MTGVRTLIAIALLIAEAAHAGTQTNGEPSRDGARDVAMPAGAQVGICVSTLSGKVMKKINAE